jgi:hypothetical protein
VLRVGVEVELQGDGLSLDRGGVLGHAQHISHVVACRAHATGASEMKWLGLGGVLGSGKGGMGSALGVQASSGTAVCLCFEVVCKWALGAHALETLVPR